MLTSTTPQGYVGQRPARSQPGFRCHVDPCNRKGMRKSLRCLAVPDRASPVARLLSSNGVQLSSNELETFLAATSSFPDEAKQLEQMASNVKLLGRYLSAEEIRNVSAMSPQIFVADLGAWFDFLEQYGFPNQQISYMLCQAPQALAQATLVSAGTALTTMRTAGLDEETARAFVVNYPQLLHSNPEQIMSMLRTLSRFSTGINISC